MNSFALPLQRHYRYNDITEFNKVTWSTIFEVQFLNVLDITVCINIIEMNELAHLPEESPCKQIVRKKVQKQVLDIRKHR